MWKLTSEGAFVWARGLGAGGQDAFNNINVDAAGNVYGGGQFTGTTDLDPGPVHIPVDRAGGWDAFLVKLTGDGDFVWARQFGGSASDEGAGGTASFVDSVGDVYLTGSTFRQSATFGPGPDSFTVTSRGGEDGILIKLNGDGDLLWNYQFGGPGNDGAGAFLGATTDTVYLTGYFEQTVDFDPGPGTHNLTSAGDWDMFLMALSPEGDLVRRRRRHRPRRGRPGWLG